MFKKKKEKLSNTNDLTKIKTNKSFKDISKKLFKFKREKKTEDVISKPKKVKSKKPKKPKKIKEKENFKSFFKLTFARLLAKLIDLCLTWFVMFLLISIYIIYAFNKVKNYIIRVYTESLNVLNVSTEIIVERQVELENIESFFMLIKTLMKYQTLEVIISVYGIFFLGGYLTFYFISMFLVEILFINKKGQTLGKKICNIRLTKERKWWQSLLRFGFIYFGNVFLLISYISRFRKKRAMIHEHLLNNYVIFNYDYKEDDVKDENDNK